MKKFQSAVCDMFCIIVMLGMMGACFMCDNVKTQILWSVSALGIVFIGCIGTYLVSHASNIIRLFKVMLQFLIYRIASIVAPSSNVGKAALRYSKHNSWSKLFDKLLEIESEVH